MPQGGLIAPYEPHQAATVKRYFTCAQGWLLAPFKNEQKLHAQIPCKAGAVPTGTSGLSGI
jgi:hypothetical protein